MSITVTYRCPHCLQILEVVKGGRNLGPPVIRCPDCHSLIKTGWHKHVTFRDKFIQGGISCIVGIFWFLGFTFAYLKNNNAAEITWIVGLAGGLLFMGMGIKALKALTKYERSPEAHSDDIPHDIPTI